MPVWNLVYGCLTLMSGIVSTGLAAYLVHDWRNNGARRLFFLLAASSVWSVAYGLELLCPDPGTKLLWVRLEFSGVSFIGVLLLRFVMAVTGRRLPAAGLRALWGIPLLVALSAFTNSWHHLMWTDVRLISEPHVQALEFSRGPMFWVHVGYSYVLILICSGLLIRTLSVSRGPLKRQAQIMLPGILVPWLANGVYVLDIAGMSLIDTGPPGFMLTCVVLVVGLFRYHLANLIPLAREAVMDGLEDPVLVMDINDHIVEVNRACARACGLAHFTGRRDRAGTRFPELYEAVRSRRTARPVSFNAALDMGTGARDWRVRISPLWGRRGLRSGWLVVLRDITEQNRTEAQLRNAGNYVDSILNAMPSAVIGVDRDGIVTHWNDGAARLTRMDGLHACGGRLTERFPQSAPYLEDLNRAMETGTVQRMEKQRLAFPAEASGAGSADGADALDVVIADIVIFPVMSDTRPGAVIRVEDVGDQVRIQEMMVQSEKMMSVGGLAAGMAHEINNPLSGMVQAVQVIRNRLTAPLPANIRAAERHGVDLVSLKGYLEDRSLFRMMAQAEEAGARAAKIVENMLSFSRKSAEGSRSSHHLPEMVDTTLAILKNDYNLRRHYDFRSVEIVRSGTPDLPPVTCEKSEIQQVLFNILKNGTEAMAMGKTGSPRFIVRYFREKGMAGVELQDNGPGFAEAVRRRIFEPFFTTKPVGMGTGLGLSVSYYIVVENHGGELSARSYPGKGAVFTIKLPIRERKK